MNRVEDVVPKTSRILGRLGEKKEPVFVVIGGIHGNEPAGVEAIERVIRSIEKEKIQIRGCFIALRGNIKALQQGKRFIQMDLNRLWTEANLQCHECEEAEFEELESLYEEIRKAANGLRHAFLLDLHTTSASSSPFFILGDTIRNRRLTARIPVPKVLGIEEQIEGTLSTFMNEEGLVAINFEAGSHEDPGSVHRHEAAIWLALTHTGLVKRDAIPFYSHMRGILRSSAKGLPRIFESIYRYGIAEGENFKMLPGYFNFKPIHKGEVLASSNGKPVKAPLSGRIFMPLYQEQGDDGFFVIRKINPFWLLVSLVLRLTMPRKWVVFLPGIKRCKRDKWTVRVNKKIARWYPVKILHLLGYRKVRDEGNRLLMSRRKYDLFAPEKIEL